MTAPKITTVLPTYRRPKMLVRAIRSVLAQTYQDVVVVVYDNASGDETADVVAEIARRDPRVRYHRHDRNIGSLANMNYGFAHVETPYFSLLSDDDVILPDMYARAMEAFERWPEAWFACTRTVVLDELQHRVYYRNRSWTPGFHQPSVENVVRMMRDNFITTGVVLRRELVDEIGGLDASGSDHNYVIVAAAARPFVAIDRDCAILLIHGQSFSSGRPQQAGPSQAEVGVTADHLVSSFFALMGRLFDRTSFPAADKIEMYHRAIDRLREQLMVNFLKVSVPLGRYSDLRTITAIRRELRLTLVQRLALALVRGVVAIPGGGTALRVLTRLGVSVRSRLRKPVFDTASYERVATILENAGAGSFDAAPERDGVAS